MERQGKRGTSLEVLKLSGNPIYALTWACDLTVLALKELLSPHAETPAQFLELIHENHILGDLEVISLHPDKPTTLFAYRKDPPPLLEFLRNLIKGRFVRRFRHANAFMASRKAAARVVKYILAADSDGSVVNQKEAAWYDPFDDFDEYRNCTALHYAACFGETQICKALLDHPRFEQANSLADVAMPFSYSSVMDFVGSSCTALHCAVAWYRPEVCSLLLHHSCFSAVGEQNAGGQTVLHMAVLNGETDLVAELLQDGRIDAGARTLEGLTAVELALLIRVELSCYGGCRGKYDKILALLLERSPDADSVNVLSVALATFDKPLEQVALSCLRRRGKFLAGMHVGNGRLDASQFFRNELAQKEDRWRKKFVQKQKEFSRKQNVAAKRLRNRQSSDEEQLTRRPAHTRARDACAFGADDWQIYR
ncbi:ascc3 [Symbiodinium natans]|uniref:Ascc3 protein n=1 Tax=Symbiodinium natans TaxID=878477 RepID=A0A812NRE2_9DINO|nr:ascc3 [Symbiodinium natans]